MAGRAIWGDAVGRLAPQDRASGAALAARRLDGLAELLEGHGEGPRGRRVPMAEAATVVGESWYRSFGASGD